MFIKIKEQLHKIRNYGLILTCKYVFMEMTYRVRILLFGSYSQLGEDLVILKYFPKDYKGFYVDVGANDPFRFNNTALLYKLGWRGINIEPNSIKIEKFKKHRVEDTNLCVGVDEMPGELSYFKFIPDTLNTFSEDEATAYKAQGFEFLGDDKISVKTLTAILGEHLPEHVVVDVLSIDTEGYDLNVLKSLDFTKYSPRFICIEAFKHDTSDRDTHDSSRDFVINMGYKQIYSNGINSILENEND